ncbi:MAG: hypothetical protein N2689_15675 [Verrucomicrobiae bacterium]|nr:hypothetical protein [Verrucomicrobiae bacterium]
MTHAAQTNLAQSLAPFIAPTNAPRIVVTQPAIGASEVDPALKEIGITFDRDMAPGFAWTGGDRFFPNTRGMPRWKDKRTCVLGVALEPAKFYRVGINAPQRRGFRSAEGVPAETWAIWFTTRGAPPELVAKLQQPKVLSTLPQNGDRKVDPRLSEIRITFDQEMSPGYSVVGDGPLFPKDRARPYWDASRTTLIWPVDLEPNHEYKFGLNNFGFKNCANLCGVPLAPVVIEFKTR